MTRNALPGEESDDETNGGGVMSKAKKARADAVQTARQSELREKEKERERTRAEAAGRRQERAGRRRVDGASRSLQKNFKVAHADMREIEAEPADETPKAGATAKISPPASSQPPSPPTFAVPEKVSHKKGAGKKVKKLGNNQYTKPRDPSTQPPPSSPHNKKRPLANHPQAADSGEEQGAVTGGGDAKLSPGAHDNGNGNAAGIGRAGGPGRFAKGKGKTGLNNGPHARHHPNNNNDEPVERTFANMKRSMDGMMAFMQRHQVDMAAGGGDRTPPDDVAAAARGSSRDGVVRKGQEQEREQEQGRPFAELSSMEMADVVARSITKWNALYAQHV